MEDIPLHAAIVHIPLGTALVVPWIGAAVAIALARGAVDKRAWAVAVALQAFVVVGGFVAMNTGEAEEKTVARIVDERWIEEHEHRAEPFVWSAGITLAIAAGVLLLGPQRVALGAAVAVAGMLFTLALAYRVGESGGQLVYKHGAASAYATPKSSGDTQ